MINFIYRKFVKPRIIKMIKAEWDSMIEIQDVHLTPIERKEAQKSFNLYPAHILDSPENLMQRQDSMRDGFKLALDVILRS